ncbi:MAG TPA: DUF3048 domain-containing protein [Nevskiaceae bacterium]|nr:DUF3048 domain-containing protein [Nevskiaceae bacterium]
MNDFISMPRRRKTSDHADAPNTHTTPATFQPPQTVAEAEERQADTPRYMPASNFGSKPPKTHWWRHPIQWFKRLNKRQKIIFCVIVVLLIGSAVAAFLVLNKPEPVVQKKTVKTAKKVEVKPTTVASKLTGLQVDPSVNERPVTAVMIENSLDARPQSGIDQAGVVFEAVAEGGITRFLNLFQDTAPEYIGPVRSVRTYYVQWLMGFDASVAHVGGSADALANVKSWGTKDLDQFANGSYYHRISSRFAPHNVYTSMAELNAIEAKKGYGTSKYTGFERKAAQPAATATVKTIDLAISSAVFNAHFDYDAPTNSYKRSEGGKPHMVVDKAGNQTQIAPKVVAVMVSPQGKEALGSGQLFVFQDGTLTQGTWQKTDKSSQIKFTDTGGKTLKLNPGQTWVTALGGANLVTYAP